MHLFRMAPLLVLLFQTAALAGAPDGLVYSGRTSWEPATGVLTFESSGAMPDTREGFHWSVPAEVRGIVIGEGVTVTGAFRVGHREPANPLHITGRNRATSVLHGTEAERWTTENGVADNARWKYGAVSVLADAEVRIADLTSLNPRGYHFSGYAPKAVLHVRRCYLLDTRNGSNNNSDGFVGAAGSSIADSLISTSDDGIKVYRDITIRNVTIEQHRNGAPVQFGWGGETNSVRADIENLTIVGVDPQQRYNMAPFTWERGTHGKRDITVRGLNVRLTGQMYDEDTRTWGPAGLFELKPTNCTLNATVAGADLHGLGPGIRNTQGSITIDGTTL